MSDTPFDRARRVIPGGVNSPVRAFGSVGGDPVFVRSGEGAYLTDEAGVRRIDYVQSWGASILGHAAPPIVEAVQAAAAEGTSFGAPTVREVELAEAIVDRVPSVDKVRLVNSGTEAGMTAVRLARGATGRAKILKFAGCYHGHLDALLVAAGSGLATLGLPDSAGVTPGTVSDTVVVAYNDAAALDAAFDEHGEDLAAVLVEPVAANMGLVAPKPDFLESIRELCTKHGTVLIFDEVITGFRLGPGGAQERFGLTPDLTMMGKVIGGGLPLAAVGGRADLMDHLAPLGAVYQAGTLSGNPLATAAGSAALGSLTPEIYTALEATVALLAGGLTEAFEAARVPAHVVRVGTLAGLFFTSGDVTNYQEAQAADHDRYARWFHGMLDAGVALAPSGYEVMFTSVAHTTSDVDRTIEAAAAVAATLE